MTKPELLGGLLIVVEMCSAGLRPSEDAVGEDRSNRHDS
jgi:hypothetical protein